MTFSAPAHFYAADRALQIAMIRVASDEPGAFGELHRLLAPSLSRYLLRLTGNAARASDLLQVTFVKLYRCRARYRHDAPVQPWARAIAHRTFIDEVRSCRARPDQLSATGELPETPSSSPEPLDTPEHTLRVALDELPPLYRQAIALTKVTGLSVEEAAAELGTTPLAVRLRVHRGYSMLRERLSA
jgi:RNA polymerase sigma factor (sigma-70 family)